MQDSYNKIVSLFTDKTFIKFVLVGMVISSASNYIVGSIVSYFLNKYFTFSYHGSSWKSIAKFIINIAVCYVIAYSIAKPLMMWLLSGYSITVQENVSMTFGMFTALNYLGQRFFAFKQ